MIVKGIYGQISNNGFGRTWLNANNEVEKCLTHTSEIRFACSKDSLS
jgi:hypothetical protein